MSCSRTQHCARGEDLTCDQESKAPPTELSVLPPKDADGMTNIADLNQTVQIVLPLLCFVC